MKLARYEHQGRLTHGMVEDDSVWVLPAGLDPIEALVMAVEGREIVGTGDPVPLEEVSLTAPLDPPSVRDFVAFEQHIEGMVKTEGPGATVPESWYKAPAFYFSSVGAVFGDGDEIEVPPGCQAFDYELEVGAIIGRPGRDLTLDDAGGHIVGYTIFNDWSARDLQKFDLSLRMGWAKGKDSASTLGPWIVSADELEGARDREGRLDLRMTVFLNGEEIGSDSLASAAWSFEQMLVYASRGCVLRSGDVIGSGTCGGGCLGELWGRSGERVPPPLAPGDEVRMTVEGIGSISNRIVAGVDPVDFGSPRRRGQEGH
ncbi:MAG: fumarylacetoacetate hydrolase family protein [Solirubrobacterales bacterium]